MSQSKWKRVRRQLKDARDWLKYAGPGILVGFALSHWAGWNLGDSFYAGVFAMIVLALLLMSFEIQRDTKVIAERIDPDFGELTIFRDSWLSVLEVEFQEERVFISGEGAQGPTMIQRSTIIDIIDSWSRWIKELDVTFDTEKKKGVPEKPWEIEIVEIELEADEVEWKVSFVLVKEGEDHDWTAKYCDGAMVALERS